MYKYMYVLTLPLCCCQAMRTFSSRYVCKRAPASLEKPQTELCRVKGVSNITATNLSTDAEVT